MHTDSTEGTKTQDKANEKNVQIKMRNMLMKKLTLCVSGTISAGLRKMEKSCNTNFTVPRDTTTLLLRPRGRKYIKLNIGDTRN